MSPNEAEQKGDKIADEASMLAPEEATQYILKETADFPPNTRRILRTLIAKWAEDRRTLKAEHMSKLDQEERRFNRRIVMCGFILGALGLAAIGVSSVFLPPPRPDQYWITRTLMALCAAGFASGFTGMLNIRIKAAAFAVAATGGLAVFWVVYRMNPPPPPSLTPAATVAPSTEKS